MTGIAADRDTRFEETRFPQPPSELVRPTIINLRTVTNGGRGIVAPPGRPVYGLQVRALSATQLPNLALQLGNGSLLRLRGQGDSFHFALPETNGVFLVMLQSPFVAPGTIIMRDVFVEVLVAYHPSVQFPQAQDDAWAVTPWYMKSLGLLPNAGQLSIIKVVNRSDTLPPALGKLRRLLLWSAAAGELLLTYEKVAAAAGFTQTPPLHLDQHWNVAGQSSLGMLSVSSAGAVGTQLGLIQVEAGRTFELNLDVEIGRPDDGPPAQQNSLAVHGLVDTSLRVTALWQERTHFGEGNL